MRDYQFEKVREQPDKALTEDTRVLTDEDLMRYGACMSSARPVLVGFVL